MKSFATPKYITPVLEEIKARYTPEYSPATLAALNCAVLLKRNRTREYIAIRENDRSFYYSDNGRSAAMKALFADLKAWTEAAETYAGELDGWSYQEERRIMEAVRDALIKEYGKPETITA